MSSSDLDDLPSQAWVLQIQDMPQKSYEHVRNVLRYGAASGVVDSEQLASLLALVDNFVVPVADREAMAEAALARAMTESSSSGFSGSGSGDEEDPDADADTEEDEERQVLGQMLPAPGRRMQTLAATMEHPVLGVKVGRQRHRFHTYNNVFTGADAAQWLVDRGFASTVEDAVAAGTKLLNRGHIVHVSGRRGFEAGAAMFYRFSKHPAPLTLRMPAVSSSCPSLAASLLRLVYAVHDDTVPRWLASASAEHLRVAFPAVLLWSRQNPEAAPAVTERLVAMSSEDRSLKIALWGFHRANDFKCMSSGEECAASKEMAPTGEEVATMELMDGNRTPAKAIAEYTKAGTGVQHPFTNQVASEVRLVKEFTSAAKPAWVSFHDAAGGRILPDAVAKAGDDLRKDLAVQLIFQAAAAFWKAAPVAWRCGRAPTVGTFEVVATSDRAGYLQFVKGKTVKEVAANKEWDDVDLHKFAPSAVGSLMSGFVLGVRDRHSENWMLVGDPKEDPRLVQIDFGYCLMEAPGGLALDTPRLTLQPQLIRRLRATPGHDGNHTLLEDIQHDLITAYRVLRQHYPAFVSFAKVVLSNVYPQAKITGHLWGVHAFRAGQSEVKALRWIEDKVMTQLTERNLRRGAKHAIVRAYYGFKGMT